MRGILKSIMPTKHERDMKALWPIVNTINEAYNKIIMQIFHFFDCRISNAIFNYNIYAC